MEELLGRDLPLALLLKAPTIAELSRLLNQEGWAPSWSSLVPINPEGFRPPLFLVHAGGGNILSYRRLSQHLGVDQPVWGLQSQGLRADREVSSRIEDIAEDYLQAIRYQWPDGPYLLGGHSFGALVAFEMAQRLLAEGHQVPYLAVLDHAGPDAKVGRTDWIRWHLICLSQLEAGDKVRYVRDGLGYRMRSNIKMPLWLRRMAAGSLDKNDGSRKATIRLRQLQGSLAAMAEYRIKPYAGPIHVFRADKRRRGFTRTHGAAGRESAKAGWPSTRSRDTT